MELYPIRIDVSYPPVAVVGNDVVTSSLSSTTISDSTTTTGSNNNNNNSTTTPNTNNSTKIIRIVDSIIIDPNMYNTDDSSKFLLLLQQLAHSIVTDAYVVGTYKQQQSDASSPSENEKSTEFLGRYTLVDTTITATTGKQQGTTTTSSSSIDIHVVTESLIQQVVQQVQNQLHVIHTFQQKIQQLSQYNYNYQTTQTNSSSSNNNSNNNTMMLITIPIHMEIPGSSTSTTIAPIRIQDEIIFDLNTILNTKRNYYCNDTTTTPILIIQEIVQSIIHDLQLSYDTIPILTIHILEQIILAIIRLEQQQQQQQSLLVSSKVDATDEDYDIEYDEGIQILLSGSNDKVQQQAMVTTAAWEISSTIQNTNQTYIESFYK